MDQLIKKSYFISSLVVCGILTAIKILSLYYTNIPLWVDEAQYWGWSKELATGYFSKPPLIAWLIHNTTKIFGDSEFGIRVGAPLLHFFTAIFVFFIAASLTDKRTAFFSAVVYITLPAVAVSSSFISTDAPLIFFWAAALYFLITFTRLKDKWHILLIAYAISVGLGLLSKYTMAAFVLMSFYYIYSTREGRGFFKMDFWIANIIAFLIFAPNLYWNYNNHFISFVHTQENVISGKSAGGLKFADMLEFIGGQIAVFGLAFIFYIFILLKKETYRNKVLVLFSAPLVLIGIIISLLSGAQAHWAAAAYVTASILVVEYILRNNKLNWLKIIIISNLVIFLLCLDVKIPASIASIKKDPLERVTIWYKLEQPLKIALADNPEAIIVSDERKIIATMMYALKDLKGNPKVIYKWNPQNITNDHYSLTRSFKDASEKPVLFISRSDVSEGMSGIYFNIDRLKTADEEFPFYLFLLKGRR